MELDKRIKALTDIQSVTNGCNDWLFMTKMGYFANSIFNFKDLKRTCVYGEYAAWREHNQCFLCRQGSDTSYFSYFIPEDSLSPKESEKKYRAFTAVEFVEKFEFWVGKIIRLREKKPEYALTQYEYKTVFTGYRWCDDTLEVFLNENWITLQTLFENYEYMENDEWQPFGVLDEGDTE